jgi:hypothetical protein
MLPDNNLTEMEARCAAATPGPYRLLPTDQLETDPDIAANGCSIVAYLGGLGADGRHVWVIVDMSGQTPAMGPYSWGDLFASAPTDIPLLLTHIREQGAELEAARRRAETAEREAGELRARLNHLFAAYSGTLVRQPGDSACNECVTAAHLCDDAVIPGFRCVYHEVRTSLTPTGAPNDR